MFENYDGKMVLDADGLNILAYNNLFDLIKDKENIVITPHMGEAKRLLGHLKEERKETAIELYRKTKAITVLKGHATVVATNSEKTYINTTGNPGMATAGSGDVLTGIITSLLGQGKSAKEAALAGVFVHGLAGDLAAETVGEYGLIAGDIAYYTAIALKEISGSTSTLK